MFKNDFKKDIQELFASFLVAIIKNQHKVIVKKINTPLKSSFLLYMFLPLLQR